MNEDEYDEEESTEEVPNYSEVQSVHYKENDTSPMCYTVSTVFDAPAQAPVTHSLPIPVITMTPTHYKFNCFLET